MDLFPTHFRAPHGFEYIPEFLSHEEEDDLVKHIRHIALHAFNFQGFQARRKTQSFGYDYSFDKRSLSKGEDIPPQFLPLIAHVAELGGIEASSIAELLITEYPPGAVINWHRDAPPFKDVMGVSLLEDCAFKFRPHEKGLQGRKSVLSIPVARRSLYFIRGEARLQWEHSISPVAGTRYSITLRTLK